MMKSIRISFTLFFFGCTLQLLAQNPLVGTWERQTDSIWSTKIITPTHWMVYVEYKEIPKGNSTKFFGAAGGTYTLMGTKYIEYAQVVSRSDFEKSKTDFTVKMENDKFYQKGTVTLADGTVIPIDEVWRKVRPAQSYPNNPAIGAWNQLSSSYTDEHGQQASHTHEKVTRFEIITPSHWMRIGHWDKKFDGAFGGTYTLTGNKMIAKINFSSFPGDKKEVAVLTQKVSGDKRYTQGVLHLPNGKTMTWEDVFHKDNGKIQMAKSTANK
jgi:hypothetical protein